MPIHTVLGPIEPAELGLTSMHEHLIVDASVWYEPPTEEPLHDAVALDTRGYLQWNPLGLRDNLVIDDDEAVGRELRRVHGLGGSGIVDLTVVGLGRQVDRLPAISRASGLHVMIGCGFYVHESHPEWLEAMPVDDVTAGLIGELTDGLDGTGILPAMLGEIGTSAPVTDRERKVLVAAGQAGAATGASINLHLDRRGAHALDVIELLVAQGMTPDRIVCSHLDERLDWEYHRAIAESGAILEYDTFGQEFYFGPLDKNPSDVERLLMLERLLSDGWKDQIVLGCDVWIKATLATYGGMGYEHLLARIAPALRAALGLDEATVRAMLVDTPRRLLDRP